MHSIYITAAGAFVPVAFFLYCQKWTIWGMVDKKSFVKVCFC